MLNRIINLVMLQLGHKLKIKNRNDFILKTIFKIAGFVLIGTVSFILMLILKKYVYLTITNSMILFVIFLSQILNILANASDLTKSLYGSKDNAILLSLPALNNEIFISKLIVFFIIEFNSNIMFLLPILLSYGIFSQLGVLYYFLSIIISVLLPLVSVLIGALISIPLSVIFKFLRKVSIVYLLVFFSIMIFSFHFVVSLMSKLPMPFRLVALYNKVINDVLAFVEKANNYSLFYKWFSNVLFNINPWLNALYILLLIIGLIGINILISQPLFFKLASNTAENAVQKNHKGKNKNSKNLFFAFYKKELIISYRNIGKLINNYILIFVMPLVLYILNKILVSMNLSSLGKNFAFGANIIIGLLMMIGSNISCATALSEEGSEFVLLKTSPAETEYIAWAKVFNNVIISTLLLIISLLMLNILNILNPFSLLIMGCVFFFVNTGHILWSFQLDLCNPQIKEVASTGTISNQTNVSKSLSIGSIFSILFGGLSIILLYNNSSIAPFIIIFLSIVFFIWRLFVFKANLKAYFYEIEL